MEQSTSEDISLVYSTEKHLYNMGIIKSPYSNELNHWIMLLAAVVSVSLTNYLKKI